MSSKRAKKLSQRAATLDSSHDILLLNYPASCSTNAQSSSSMLNLPCEKVFNDAFLTGNLNLCSRQLKEFPIHYSQCYDISDLVTADLSNNCICELPACVCQWQSLETLKFCSNGLRSIPASISSLCSLTFLDLSNNHISILPNSLFSLPLNVLILSGNRLETLNAEIKNLGETLQELDLKANRLRQLPAAIALLTELRVLNLRSNQLKDLPGEVGCLNLRILDVTSNLLIRLPIELHKLVDTCLELNANGNPLMEPPISVVQRGSAHIFKWLSNKAEQLGTHQSNHYPPTSYADFKLGSTEPQSNGNGMLYNFNNHLDFTRVSNLNATIRRSDRASLARNVEPQRRPERRSRSIKSSICTVGPGPFNGTDSGYITGDDQQKHDLTSNQVTVPKLNGNIGYIDELTTTNQPTKSINGGELAREILMTFEQTKLNGSVDGSNGNLQNTTNLTSISKSTFLDLSNNNTIRREEESEYRPSTLKFATNSAHLSATILASNNKQSILLPVIEHTERAQLPITPLCSLDLKFDSMNASNISINSTASSQVTILNGCTPKTRLQKENSICPVKQSTKSSTTTIQKSTNQNTNGSIQQNQPKSNNPSDVKKSPLVVKKSTIKQAVPTVSNGIKRRDFVCQKTPTTPRKSPLNGNGTTTPRSPLNTTKSRTGSTLSLANGKVDSVSKTRPVVTRSNGMAKGMSAKVQPIAAKEPLKVQNHSNGISKVTTIRPPISTMSKSTVIRPPTNVPFKKAGSVDNTAKQSTVSRTNSRPQLNGQSTKTTTKTITSRTASTLTLNGNTVNQQNGNNTGNQQNGHSPSHVDVIKKSLLVALKDVKLEQSSEKLAQQLGDGVLLCLFVNSLSETAVPTIIKPSSTHPLSVTRARRNVENFVNACRDLGVPDNSMCHTTDILDRKNLPATARTISFLAKKFSLTT